MRLCAERRIKWVDIAKALSIILIVIGHTSSAGVVHKIVYSFHVPAFFLLSGVTTKTDCTMKAICKDFKRIMIPYFSFGIISIFVYSILGSFAASKLSVDTSPAILRNICELVYGSCRGEALQFNRSLWFLPSLFATKLLDYLLHHIFKTNRMFLVLAAVFGSVVSFWYTNNDLYPLPLSFELTLKMFPFFLAGIICAPHLISLGNYSSYRWAFFAIGGILFGVTCILGSISPSINYTNNAIPNAALFYSVAALGCMSVYCISVAICQNRPLEYLGKQTLSVLVMHKFPIVFFQVVGPFREFLMNPESVKSFFCGVVPVATIAIFMCLGVGYVMERTVPWSLGKSAFRNPT